jgi:hypothetical protein
MESRSRAHARDLLRLISVLHRHPERRRFAEAKDLGYDDALNEWTRRRFAEAKDLGYDDALNE